MFEFLFFTLEKTGKHVEKYLINDQDGKNSKILNGHSGKCANIVELKSIFIDEHVLLLDR